MSYSHGGPEPRGAIYDVIEATKPRVSSIFRGRTVTARPRYCCDDV